MGWLEGVRIALDHGVRQDVFEPFKGYPIHRACQQGHLEIVRELVRRGCKVNKIGAQRETPLHSCARSWEPTVRIAEFIIQQGCRVDARNTYGDTPLSLAAFYDNVDIVRVLLSHGADRSLRNKIGKTPLDEAKYQLAFHLDLQANPESPEDCTEEELAEANEFQIARLYEVIALLKSRK
jgi:ankyrin repeat protein